MFDLSPLSELELEWVRDLRNRNAKSILDGVEWTPQQHRAWFIRLQYKKYLDFYVIKRERENVGTLSVSSLEKDYYRIGDFLVDAPFAGESVFAQVFEMIRRDYHGPFRVEIPFGNALALQTFKNIGFRERSTILEL